MTRLRVTVIFSLWAASAGLHVRQSLLAVTCAQAPTANPQDVNTVDAIIQTLYQVISGPAGQKRDWDRFRTLFAPGARLIPALARKGEKPTIRVLDVEQYIRRTDAIFEKEDFWEIEKERRMDTSGNLVHAFSMYESRHKQGDLPFQTGVNSIQLFSDGTRWWIVTVMWNSTR